MTANLSQYGAVTAKVRAMYGLRLRGGDYEKISSMKSVTEVADFLHDHPGWGAALSSTDTASLRRDRLESILRRHSLAHFLRLFLYMRREDRTVLRYTVMTAELEQLMRFMRLAAAGNAGDYMFDLPDYFNKQSRIRYDLLSSAETYGGLLEAVRNTGFYESLLRLQPADGSFPPFLLVETHIRRYYYKATTELLRGKGGKSGSLLREAVGIQADWDNIVTIDRILRYYPSLMPNIFSYLLPAGAHIKPVELKAMIALENPGGLSSLLEQTYYGRYTAGRESLSLEMMGQTILMMFFKRHMAGGEPSVFMPIAYINLYQNELRNLIHIIESVRYGLDAEAAEKFLILL